MLRLSKRALSLFPHGTVAQADATLLLIAGYAAQNPGLEFGNYGNVTSYRAESRRISNDLKHVREAMHKACYTRVTDADVIEACRRAFSGRLTVTLNRIDYCTGQYWPTEYRKACAAVLEAAAMTAAYRIARTA